MITPLATFMSSAGFTDDRLAKLVGRERSTITKIRLGQARPSLDLAIKIAGLSEGKVPPTAYPILRRAREAAE